MAIKDSIRYGSEAPMKEMMESYQKVRNASASIAEPLSPEDCVIQTMPDASPIRWHLAHTTWFFETFVLKPLAGYRVFDGNFEYLFNSYYNAVGDQYPRPQRGLLSRPGQAKIVEYRESVDQQIIEHLEKGDFDQTQLDLIALGLHHEQQHQELMVTDLKHLLFVNSLYPEYRSGNFDECDLEAGRYSEFQDGFFQAGHSGNEFCFDNELPSHKCYTGDFEISGCLVSCVEYLEFMNDGGYLKPNHWLSLGWNQVTEHGWNSPMYWKREDDQWKVFTLAGWQPVNDDWPVSHISYFEADAYARWSGNRLPTEMEWERACTQKAELGDVSEKAQFLDRMLDADLVIHPTRCVQSMLGGVWEWTQSSYAPYPGFQPAEGAVGEYNGKFMCNQYVLRGGSVATPKDHIRPTYRNFFPPETRWQFSGIRLAND